MNTFAYIANTVHKKHLRDYLPLTRALPGFSVPLVINSIPVCRVFTFNNIRVLNKKLTGHIIVLAHSNADHAQHAALLRKKIKKCFELAKKLKTKILGVDVHLFEKTSNFISESSKAAKIPVTHGIYLSSWSAYEGIYRYCKFHKINPAEATVAVLGSLSECGKLCSLKIGNMFKKLIIQDYSIDTLQKQVENLFQKPNEPYVPVFNELSEVAFETDINKAVEHADIIINASDKNIHFDVSKLKKPCCFCDINPHSRIFNEVKNISGVTALAAGFIKPPVKSNLGGFPGMPLGLVPASFAETVLACSKEKYRFKKPVIDLTTESLEEMADLAAGAEFQTWMPQVPIV